MHAAAPYKRPYCLHCYAVLEPWGQRASQACQRCGHSTLLQDTRVYWTRERDMSQWEAAAKVFTFLVAALVGAWLLTSKGGFGTGQGWAIGFPLAIIGLGCETAGKLTKYKPYFRADLAWFFLALSPAFLILLVLLLNPSERGIGGLLMVSLVGGGVLAALVLLASNRFCKFRERQIMRGQE